MDVSIFIDSFDHLLPYVPKVLIESLLLDSRKSTASVRPSIRTVEGAFLFVDISGFSSLGNRVSVDVLQSVIKNYFTLLLDVINQHNGDIVKFAGDALLCVWVLENSNKDQGMADVIRIAAACGAELNRTCCNYNCGSSLGVVLNVHSSLTYGEISIVNVGHDGRWECLLLGKPVFELEKTIDKAQMGKMVMTEECHSALYSSSENRSFADEFQGNASKRMCKCTVLPQQCYELCYDDHEDVLLSAVQGIKTTHSHLAKKAMIKKSYDLQAKTRKSAIEANRFAKYLYNGILGHVHEAARSILNIEEKKDFFAVENGAVDDDLDDAISAPVNTMLEGELREIVTVFIKLHIDVSSENIADNGSLSNSDDSYVLQKLQQCMEICVTGFNEQGGQLRQLIVDDKGCVCIGNFGLRLSVTLDDCAAAVTASQNIHNNFLDVGIRCSIGISTGSVYCGTVGVGWRHEYTCMGTTVNLAARLMSASSKYNDVFLGKVDCEIPSADSLISKRLKIRCEERVRAWDRSHSYVFLSPVRAKGYAEEISTFRPIRYIDFDPSVIVDSFGKFKMKPVQCGEVYGGRLGELEEAIDFLVQMSGDADAVPSKILLVVGEQSIGTERFLTSLENMMGSFTAPQRFAIFRGKAYASNGSIMFILWKRLLGDLFTYVGKTLLATKAFTKSNGKPFKFIALDFIVDSLPPSIKGLAPLLTHFGFLPKSVDLGNNTSILQMSESAKLAKVIEFISAALDIIVSFIRKLPQPMSALIFSIDNIQHIDSSSWSLVEYVIKNNIGVLFTATYTSKDENNVSNSSTDSRDGTSNNNTSNNSMSTREASINNEDVMSDMSNSLVSNSSSNTTMTSVNPANRESMGIYAEDKTKACSMCLGPLSRNAVWQLVVSVYNAYFESTDKFLIDEEDESGKRRVDNILDRLRRASGGHVLHVLDIVSTVCQTGQCSCSMDFFDKLECVLSNIKSDKIDDLIYYNFDLLLPQCQLILKAASIIAATGSYFSAAMIGNMLADILFKKSHADESITPSSSITSLALQSSTPVASEGGVVKESASHQQGNFSGMLACSTPTADGAVSSDKSTTESSIVDNNKDSSIDKKGQHKDVEDEAEIKTSTPSDFLKVSMEDSFDLQETLLNETCAKSSSRKEGAKFSSGIFDTDRDNVSSEGEDEENKEWENKATQNITAELATFVPSETAVNEAVELVMVRLHEIVSKSIFLKRIHGHANEGERVDENVETDEEVVNHKSRVESFDSNTNFMFASSIYQEPIYGMMLGQQKIEFHSKFASYLENIQLSKAVEADNVRKADGTNISSNDSGEGDSVSQGASTNSFMTDTDENSSASNAWRMQGFHWQRSNAWMKAAGCFFQTAKLLTQNGAYHDANLYFSWSFNMLQYLREESGEVVTHHISVDPITGFCKLQPLETQSAPHDTAGSAPHDDSTHNNDDGTHNSSAKNSSNGESLEGLSNHMNILEEALAKTWEISGQSNVKSAYETRSSIALHTMFKGDILSLETAIMMVVKFSQSLLFTNDDQSVVSTILQYALNLIMMSRKTIMKKISRKAHKSFYHTPYLHPLLYSHLASNDVSAKNFNYLRAGMQFYLRDMSVIFPILSTLSMQYISGFFVDDKQYSRLASLEETFLAIAGDFGDPVHNLRALAVKEWRLSALCDWDGVIKCADEIRHRYEFSQHTYKLENIYGADYALASLVSGIRSRLLAGDFSTANENYAFVRHTLKGMKHLHSIETATIQLCVSVLLMEMHEEAVELFFEYFVKESSQLSDSYSMFREYNPYIAEMLLQLSPLSESQKIAYRLKVCAGEWTRNYRFLTIDRKPNPTRRCAAVSALEMFGLGIDLTKATLSFLYAKAAFDGSVSSIQAAMASTSNNLSVDFTDRGGILDRLDNFGGSSSHASLVFSPMLSPSGVFSRSKSTLIPTTPTPTPQRTAARAAATSTAGKSAVRFASKADEKEVEGGSEGDEGAHLNLIGAIDLENDHSFIGTIDYCLCALQFIESTSNHQNPSNQLNYLNSLWLKADVLAFLSNLYSNYIGDQYQGEAYALLALDSAYESFDVAEATRSPLLALLTGQRADGVVSRLHSIYSSPRRLLRQGQVAQRGSDAILGFPVEKSQPIVDFSRCSPISSLTRDQVAVDVQVLPGHSTTITYWNRPWEAGAGGAGIGNLGGTIHR